MVLCVPVYTVQQIETGQTVGVENYYGLPHSCPIIFLYTYKKIYIKIYIHVHLFKNKKYYI